MMSRRLRQVGEFAAVAVLGLAVLLSGCSAARDPWEEAEGAPGAVRVLVSFPPLYCFARNVAGEHARVLCLAVTTGPHDYSPQGRDALKAFKADLLLVNGLGLDDWFSKVKNSSGNAALPVVEVGAAIPKDLLLRAEDDEKEEHHGKEEHHHHGDYDPHVWLGIEEAIAMVNVIRDRLGAIDPKHKPDFDRNAAAYVKELKELHEYGKKQFAARKDRKVIPMHDSMHYFARSFGLEVLESLQLQPGVEPDAAKLKKLLELATDKKAPVRAITHEPQYNRTAAENLVRQIRDGGVPDVRLVEFDTLETAPSQGQLTRDLYIRQMRKNIDDLAGALK